MSFRERLLFCILAGRCLILMAPSLKVGNFGVERIFFSYAHLDLLFDTSHYFQDSLVSVSTPKVSCTYTTEFDKQIIDRSYLCPCSI